MASDSAAVSTKRLRHSFKLEFRGDETVKETIVSNLRLVKSHLGVTSTDTDALTAIINFWISKHVEPPPEASNHTMPAQTIGAEDAQTENLIITTTTGLQNIIKTAEWHGKACKGLLTIPKSAAKTMGIMSIYQLECSNKLFCRLENHQRTWTSSPYLSNGKALTNLRVAHAYYSSGLLPSNFQRFFESAKIERTRSGLKVCGNAWERRSHKNF
jgi:hypothetical protein